MIKCSPHSIAGQNGLSRSRRVMGQINIVMPVIVFALVTIVVDSEFYAPFFIVAPMIEVKQNFAYLPYPAYKFDRASKGGWVCKVIQAKDIVRPLCGVPILRTNSTFDQNPHNESNTWYYIIGKERFEYGKSLTEAFYTQMEPKTNVFLSSEELLENQTGMGLSPNFGTELDNMKTLNDNEDGDDNSDIDSDDENANDYDEDEREMGYPPNINKNDDDVEVKRNKTVIGDMNNNDDDDDDEERFEIWMMIFE